MPDGRGPVAVAVIALLSCCVAAFVIGTPARSLRGEDAARAFLSAWRQSRNATFVADYDFTRTLSTGNQLKTTTRTVQSPPDDRLLIGLGSVSGRLNGKILRCAAAPDGSSRCVTGADAPNYASEVDGEIAGLAGYVQSARPLYAVTDFADASGQCFRLDLAIALPSPPYGKHALFCFDRATAAPSLTVIERDDATDRTEARSIRSTVLAGDLQIPTDTGQLVGVPGPTTSTATTSTTTTTAAPTSSSSGG